MLSGGRDFCFSALISAVYFPCKYTLSALKDPLFLQLLSLKIKTTKQSKNFFLSLVGFFPSEEFLFLKIIYIL